MQDNGIKETIQFDVMEKWTSIVIGGNKTIDKIVLGAKLDYQVFMQSFDEELNKLKNKGV